MHELAYEKITDFGGYRLFERVWKVNQSKEYPEGTEFSLQLLRRVNGKWIHAMRIDNQLHEGKVGTHIHRAGYVEWKDMTLDESIEYIREYLE